LDKAHGFSVSLCMEDIQGNPVSDQIDLPSTFIHKDYKNWGQVINNKAETEAIIIGMIAESKNPI